MAHSHHAAGSRQVTDIDPSFALDRFRAIMIPTSSVKLLREEVIALMELYRYNHFAISSLKPETTNQLVALESRLNQFISQVGGVAFVKSGKRSCIDSVTKVENRNTRRVWEEFVEEAAADLEAGRAHQNLICDATLEAWLQNVYRNLAVTSGFEVLQQMSQSMFACDSLNHPPGPHLYLREWIEIDPCLQFRVFVSELSITGITQRYSLYSPWLVEHRKDVEKRLLDFVTTRILPHIAPLESFCVDLLVRPQRLDNSGNKSYHYTSYKRAYQTGQEPNFSILLVQLLPFYARSANGFFEWSLDKNILTHGPYEFRYKAYPITEEPGMQVKYLVAQPLVPRFWLNFAHTAAKRHRRWRLLKLAALAMLAVVMVGVALFAS